MQAFAVRRAIVLTCCAIACVAAWGQPDERAPIKVIVGFAPGGPPDLVARKISARLAEQTGRTVTVENRAGASGTIAAAAVAQAPANGQTLLFGVAANLAVAPATLRTPPYDPVRDFTPIVEVARGAYVLLVRADAPGPGLPQWLAHARSQPGRLNYASPGTGSVHHLAMEMFKAANGLHLVHVPYRSGLYPPLLANEVQVMFESLPSPLPHLQSGQLRALAVTGPQRLPRLPAVPTLTELGVPALQDVQSWWGFVGPAGMPPAVTERLNADLRRAMADPDLVATLAGWGITLSPGTSESFGRLIADESRRWKEQVRRFGVPLE